MKVDVLDKGFVELMMCADSDLTVVNCARVSFGKESEWELRCPDPENCRSKGDCGIQFEYLSERDTKLIQFLARGYTSEEWRDLISSFAQTDDHQVIERMLNEHKRKAQHWAPFAHPIVRMRVKAPIFVVRQLFKHKIGFQESEISRRYVSDTPDYYLPNKWRSAPARNIKQGSGDLPIEFSYNHKAYLEVYQRALDTGVCPEQARMTLPQSMYTEWIWTGSLAAFARMYNQRADSHAQWEAQQYAKAIGEIMEPLFPVSWKALTQ